MAYKKIFAIFFLLIYFQTKGQETNVNLQGTEEDFRRTQLMGQSTISVSDMVRPYATSIYDTAFSHSNLYKHQKKGSQTLFWGSSGALGWLPVAINQQYNSKAPFGWNDASMIPAKGYQMQASLGFFMRMGPLQIKVNPEMVFAQNERFTNFSNMKIIDPAAQYLINQFNGFIDNPENTVNGQYRKFLTGQSSISIHFKPVALSLSTENLWWGPGIWNSLVMSNNATGFTHLSFHTTQPLKTGIGFFEWQFISGTPTSSQIATGSQAQKGYLNGAVITYQPKWIKGLTIGAIRQYLQFLKDAQTRKYYVPVFNNLFRANDADTLIWLHTKQMATVFFRYVLPNSHAELYAEYGRNDASQNLRDLIMSPEHARAYIVGAQKIFTLNRDKGFIQLQTEFTELENNNPEWTIRPQYAGWYMHTYITRGYTNEGKIIGAGIGSSSNCRNIAVQWLKANSSIGINFMQIDHDNDEYYEIFTNPAINRKWVDNVIGLRGHFYCDKSNAVKLIWNLDYIRTTNDHWLLDKYSIYQSVPNVYSSNVHAKISLVYTL